MCARKFLGCWGKYWGVNWLCLKGFRTRESGENQVPGMTAVIEYRHEQPAFTGKLTLTHKVVVTATAVIRIVLNGFFCHTLRTRNSLTELFQAVGLKSRKAGEGGEAGYGIPDGGCEDSEAVMKKVNRCTVNDGTRGGLADEPPVANQRQPLFVGVFTK